VKEAIAMIKAPVKYGNIKRLKLIPPLKIEIISF
jgi:hypothetical protein